MEKIIKQLSLFGWIKVVLAGLLLLCLLPWPYGFFNLVRFIAFIGFGILAYHYYETKSSSLAVIFGCLALMFQPFFKLALGRELWNFIDVVVAAFVIILLIKEKELKIKD